MKKALKLFTQYSICFVTLMLMACSAENGGDSSSTSRTVDSETTSSVTTLSGVIADGYLSSARVFLDRNRNRLYDNGEPSAQSGSGGIYSLQVNPGEGDLYPVVAEVIGGQTVDEDSGMPVTNSFLLEAPPGHWAFISPLTTLVKIERDKNPSFTEQQAVLSIRSQLGLSDDVSLFTDYLAISGLSASMTEEYSRTHKAAQVAAYLMGYLRNGILQNLGGQIADEEQKLVAYMVSDQILTHSDIIKQALDDERNSGVIANVQTLESSISMETNLEILNADLLALYQQRLDQNLELWDMQPPQLLSRSPSPGGSAPVDVVVTVSFDELLDETLLGSNIIGLSGPDGMVSGNISYDASQKTLTFVPSQFLMPYSHYQAILSAGLADSLGNPLGEEMAWDFATIFDKTPPPLPDF